MSRSFRSGALRSGFSLIEVLIAVIILAFALLGLGVVIPVVIHAQREAGDATLSVGAIDRAIEWVESRDNFGTTGNPQAFGIWLYDPSWSADFGWVEASSDELAPDSGRFAIGSTYLSMINRCWPQPGVASRPRFVWDFIARRMDTADGEPERLQFAIFVRPVDKGREVTFGSMYADQNGIPDRMGVGVTSTGVPTLNGKGEYSRVRTLRVRLNSVKRDRLEILSGQDPVLSAYAKQNGQKLIDNLGNVFTVVGTLSDLPTMVLIQPTVPAWLENGDDRVFEVALTPHVPSAVAIVNVGPR